jgi:protein TonB
MQSDTTRKGTDVMGTFYDPSKFVHRLAGAAAKQPGLRIASRHALFPNDRQEQPVSSNPEGREQYGLIFDTLIASGDRLGLRNPRATFGSLIIQLLLLMAVAVIPLFHVAPLPVRERPTLVHLELPPEVAAIAAKVPPPKLTVTQAPARNAIPAPTRAQQQAESHPVDTASEAVAGVPDGIPGGTPTEMMVSQRSTAPPVSMPEPAPAKRIRVASGVAEANLIHDVPPQYPPEAGRERIEGTVVVVAVIGTDGTVKDVRVESGPALLAQAAIDAVKQWRYKPYLLNGTPVEIDSRITINFTMARG